MHLGNRTRAMLPNLNLLHAGSFFDLFERP